MQMEIKMDRLEHLNWCKERAREYLDRGDPSNAISSMLSDMAKHPETAITDEESLESIGFYSIGTMEEARKFIEGFN